MASTSGIDLSVSGLASGFDWKTVVSQLADAERAPEIQWHARQSTINKQSSAFGQIKALLNTLQAGVLALKDPSLYGSRTAQVSDAALASATTGAGAMLGTFTLNISQLATAAGLNGATNVGSALSPSGDLTGVTLGTAGFATAVTGGTFTVNGRQISIATTDSLQQVVDKIATATNNVVTATYSSSSDKLTLTSSDSSQIILGSATDTSNFLQVAQLYNNGTSSISSASALGSVRTTAALSDANLTTAITGNANGHGEFNVNGVSISYDMAVDTLQSVIQRINNSSAGVTAAYNAQSDSFVLTNKVTGDIGISVQDVTGNFLAATGLNQAILVHGQNLLYTMNDGTTQLVSQTNTIGPESSSVAGLSVTALAKGTVTVNVSTDTSKIHSAIQTFVDAYNNVQSFITTQTASSTDSTGKVTAGILAGDPSANGIASSLRSLSFSGVSIQGLAQAFDQLADLGIQTNGKDNTIKLSDSDALQDALTNHLASVQSLLSDPTSGLAVQLDKFLTKTVGDDGTLTQHQAALTRQSSSIDAQVSSLEKTIAADSAHWTAEFQAMEEAQAKINQQMSYLMQQINNGTL